LEELVGAIAAGSADRALALVHTFQKEGRNLQHFCREAIRHMRNLLIARVSGADSDLIAATPDQRPALAHAAAEFSEEDLTRFFQILLQTDDDLRRKPDPRVHLEMGLLRLINAARLAPLEELLAEVRSGAPATAGSGAARGTSAAPSVVAPRRDASAAAPAAPVPFMPAPRSFAAVAPMGAPSTVAPSAPANSPALIRTTSAPQPEATPAFAPALDNPTSLLGKAEDLVASPSNALAPTPASGLSDAQVVEIKSAIQSQQKFLSELLERSDRWELEGAELRIYFSPENRAYAELLEGRDSLEKMRGVSSKVLGRPVRVCARLETVAAAAASASRGGSGPQDLRAQFERDPVVKSMLQRFGGRITEVKRNPEES
jgi:DNA polymerase-3 subunit gamma/tau